MFYLAQKSMQMWHLLHYYHPRTWKGKNFSHVCVCVCTCVCLSVCVPIQQEILKKYTYSAIPDPRCPALAYSSYNSMFGPRTVVLVSKPCTHTGAHGICERQAGKRICPSHDNSGARCWNLDLSGLDFKTFSSVDGYFCSSCLNRDQNE